MHRTSQILLARKCGRLASRVEPGTLVNATSEEMVVSARLRRPSQRSSGLSTQCAAQRSSSLCTPVGPSRLYATENRQTSLSSDATRDAAAALEKSQHSTAAPSSSTSSPSPLPVNSRDGSRFSHRRLSREGGGSEPHSPVPPHQSMEQRRAGRQGGHSRQADDNGDSRLRSASLGQEGEGMRTEHETPPSRRKHRRQWRKPADGQTKSGSATVSPKLPGRGAARDPLLDSLTPSPLEATPQISQTAADGGQSDPAVAAVLAESPSNTQLPRRSPADESAAQASLRSPPRSAPPTQAPWRAVKTNCDAESNEALVRLVKNHKMFRANYFSLRGSSAVVTTLERLCADALAQSRLVETLHEAFTGDAQNRAALPTTGVFSDNSTDASARTRILLTSEAGQSAAGGPADAVSDVLAVLHLPASVVQWLCSPIGMPPITIADVEASVERALDGLREEWSRADVRAASTRVAAGDSARTQTAPAMAVSSDAANQLWYQSWGQQQHQKQQREKEGLPHHDGTCATGAADMSSGTSDHTQHDEATPQSPSEPPAVEVCMAQWHRQHLALSAALRRLFEPVDGVGNGQCSGSHHRSARGAGTAHETEGSGVAWRDLPRTAHPSATVSCVSAAGGGVAGGDTPTQPHHTVPVETHLLLSSLRSLLKTLVSLTFAQWYDNPLQEKQNATTSTRATGAQGKGDEDAATTMAGHASGEGTQRALAKLQDALEHLQELEVSEGVSLSQVAAGQTSTCRRASDGPRLEAAQARVREAVVEYQASGPCVNVLTRIEVLDGALAGHTTLNAAGEEHAQVVDCGAPDCRSPSLQPCYAQSAVRIMVNCLLRCLLFYYPALGVVRGYQVTHTLRQGFATPLQGSEAYLWPSHYFLQHSLARYSALAERDMIVRTPAQETVAGESKADAVLRSAVTSRTTKQLVRMISILSLPTVFDHEWQFVRFVFDMPMQIGGGEDRMRMKGAVAAQQVGDRVADGLWFPFSLNVRSASAGEHEKRQLQLSVMQASVAQRQVGYKLALLFVRSLLCARGIVAAAEQGGTRSSRAGESLTREVGGSVLHNGEHRSITPHFLAVVAQLIRLYEVDHYLACTAHDSIVAESTVRTQGGAQGSCAQQLVVPFGMTRLLLSVFHRDAKAAWQSNRVVHATQLWRALRSAVISPAAAAVYAADTAGTVDEGMAQQAATPRSSSREAYAATWQVSASVLLQLSTNVPEQLWQRWWSQVQTELRDAPAQMRSVLLADREGTAKARECAAAPPATSADGPPPTVVWEETRSDDGAAGVAVTAKALHLCLVQLSELALLCAWLIGTARRECAKAGDGAAASTDSAHYEQTIQRTFAACVQSILGVLTETGVDADVGQQLLKCFFLNHATHQEMPSLAAGNEEGTASPDELRALWAELCYDSRRFLWTAGLEQQLQEWVVTTRVLQERVPKVPPKPPLPQTDAPATTSPTRRGGDATALRDATAAFPVDGFTRADPAIQGWWRSLQADDLGLPSVHIYLLQVYTELRRIVTARGEAAASAKTPQGAEAVSHHSSDGSSSSSSGSAGTLFLPQAATEAAVLTPAETAVVLRVLACISMRGGMGSAHPVVGSQADASSSSGGAGAPTSKPAGSILDALLHVAQRNRQPAQSEAGVVAAAESAADIAAAVRQIEAALLDGVHTHAALLPPSSLVEAAWLGLFPLSSLVAAFSAHRRETGGASQRPLSDAAARCGGDGQRAQPSPSLEAPSSPWMRDLHKEIVGSAHTHLVCSFFLYRFYSALCKDEEKTTSERPSDARGDVEPSGGSGRVPSPVAGGSSGAGVSSHGAGDLGPLLAALQESCVSALTGQTKITKGPQGGNSGSDTVKAVMADDTEADGVERAVVALKDNAQCYLQVFVLSSALHDQLSAYETKHGSMCTVRDAATQSREMETTRSARAALLEMYDALLSAAEGFVRAAQRGFSLEVVQMVSAHTWRLHRLHLLAMEDCAVAAWPADVQGGPVDCMSGGGEDVAERMTDGEATAQQRLDCVHRADATADALGHCTSSYARAGERNTQRLRRCRALLDALMPHIDAEICSLPRGNVQPIAKVMLLVSVKATVDRLQRHVPGWPSQAAAAGCTTDGAAAHLAGPLAALLPDTVAHESEGPSRKMTLPSPVHTPVLSRLPLAAFFQRSTTTLRWSRQLVSLNCAAVILAPELFLSLLPHAGFVRRVCWQSSAEAVRLTFHGIAATAAAQAASRQHDLDARDAIVHLTQLRGSQMSEKRIAAQQKKTVVETGGGTEHAVNDTQSNSHADVVTQLASPTAADSSTTAALQSRFSIFKSNATLQTSQAIRWPWRMVWASYVQFLLRSSSSSETGTFGSVDDAQEASIWLSALHAGGTLELADTLLFEQLLACFLFSPCLGTSRPRAALLSTEGWAALVRACATARDGARRSGYREVLEDHLVDFLRVARLAAVAEGERCDAAEVRTAVSVAVREGCQLLEALAGLYVAKRAFWAGPVRRAVDGWCAELSDLAPVLEAAGEGAGVQRAFVEYTVQLQRSFNWAVRSTGNPALVYDETWVAQEDREGFEALVEQLMETLLESNGTDYCPTPAERPVARKGSPGSGPE